ncbi:hypothetical protein E1140_03810 [Fulvivirga lutimaris]|nr:hypothetical protein [Fulvivirga lutimaris]
MIEFSSISLDFFMLKFAEFYNPFDQVLVTKFSSVAVTDDHMDQYLIELFENINNAEKPFVLISDVSESSSLSSSHRVRIANFIKENSELLKSKVICLIYVMPTPLLQFILNAIFVVNRPPVKYKVCNRYHEALNIATEQIEVFNQAEIL